MIYFGQIWGAKDCIDAENGGIRNGTQQDLNQMINHYNDVIMGMMASQITGVSVVFSTVYSGSYQRKHQSSASLAFVWGIHQRPVNSLHKGPVTWKMFPFDDAITHSEIWEAKRSSKC